MLLSESGGASRICNSCDAERNLPPNLRVPRGADALLTHANVNGIHSEDASHPQAPSDVSSRASELAECPVCSKTLVELGGSVQQEEHVRVSWSIFRERKLCMAGLTLTLDQKKNILRPELS